jgi:very-short-patch-repair endonuclease
MVRPHPQPFPGDGPHPQPFSLWEKGEDPAGTSRLEGRERRVPEELLTRARELRRKETPAEALLWERLRGRRLAGAKFRRQHSFGPFIADFYCRETRLVVELDGPIHDSRRDQDAVRDDWARANGLSVLRFSNQQVLGEVDLVLAEIAAALTPDPSRGAALTPDPSPCGRGEQDTSAYLPSPAGRRAGDEGRLGREEIEL